MKHLMIVAFAAAALGLAGCETVQYTSGDDYLARYAAGPYETGKPGENAYSSTDLDAEIREIASINPHILLPARFGLARIERGQLTQASLAEMQLWQEFAEQDAAGMGDFVPLSPLIMSSVAQMDAHGANRNRLLIENLRRGAARQHIDYLLVYEVASSTDTRQNALSVTDWTVIGLFMAPSRNVTINGTASAVLLDVRNGYPYIMASGFSEDSRTTTASRAWDSQAQHHEAIQMVAISDLMSDLSQGFITLQEQAQLAHQTTQP